MSHPLSPPPVGRHQSSCAAAEGEGLPDFSPTISAARQAAFARRVREMLASFNTVAGAPASGDAV